MKVLYLTNGYPPRQIAGTETYTAGVATEFARRGFEVKVICGGDWDSGRDSYNGLMMTERDGVTVYRLNLNWAEGPDPNRGLYYNPTVEKIVATLLDDYEPDVVHVTSCYTLSASILQTVKSRGYPLIVTLTDFWFLCPRVSLLRSDGELCDGHTAAWTCLKCSMPDSNIYERFLQFIPESLGQPLLTTISQIPFLSRQRGFRGLALDMQERKTLLLRLLNLADVLIAPSKFLAKMYSAHAVTPPIQVVEYGHDLSWVKKIHKTIQHERLVFGYVGRITHAKGVHVFTAALTRMSRNQKIEGCIWGDVEQEPDYFRTLQSAITPETPVKFFGKFSREQIGDVYGSVDVLVVPSLWYENNPLVIQEALAAGVPVIATNLGGMAEFVEHNQYGLMFEAGDVVGLTQAMQRFIEEPSLLSELQSRIPKIKSIYDEVNSLTEIYLDTSRQSVGAAPKVERLS